MATSNSDLTVRHTTPQEGEHQSGADHPYYQTLLRCTPKLVTALSGSPLSIADKLLANRLISPEIYGSLLVPSLSADNKARKMMIGVTSTVQLNSKKYIEFVQILQNDISLLSTGTVESLHNTYSAIKIELQAQEQPQTSKSHQELLSPAIDDPSAASSSRSAPANTELSQDIEVAQKMRKSLTKKFKQMVISMKCILKESNETIDHFRDSFLLDLDVFEKDTHGNFFERKANVICQASTFDALFMVLNLYWDYLNYHLLECLVREYGDADTKQSMKEYIEDLSSFMEATTLQVFWKIEQTLKSVPPPGFKETVVRYEHEILPTSSLKDVENIRLKIMDKTQIRQFAILLSAIKEGSLLITWFTLFHCEKTDQFELLHGSQPESISAIFCLDTEPYTKLDCGHGHVVHQIGAYPLPMLVIVHDIAKHFGGDVKITSTPLNVVHLPTLMKQLSPSDILAVKESLEVVSTSFGFRYPTEVMLIRSELLSVFQHGFLMQPDSVNEFIKLWITKAQNPTWEGLVAFFRKLGVHDAAQRIENIIAVVNSPVSEPKKCD